MKTDRMQGKCHDTQNITVQADTKRNGLSSSFNVRLVSVPPILKTKCKNGNITDESESSPWLIRHSKLVAQFERIKTKAGQ